jgi:CheY-like chemotaxis protein
MSRFFSPHRTHEPIVIVGDDVAFLELLREGISDAGYRTVCARDGSEALAAITNQKPAMIFVDIQMPGMDGASLLAKIERSPVLSRIPRAVVTGDSDFSFGASTAWPVLHKPVRFEQVLRTIQRFVPDRCRAAARGITAEVVWNDH